MNKSFYKLEIDSALWRNFKIKCTTQGKTILSIEEREKIEKKIKEQEAINKLQGEMASC